MNAISLPTQQAVEAARAAAASRGTSPAAALPADFEPMAPEAVVAEALGAVKTLREGGFFWARYVYTRGDYTDRKGVFYKGAPQMRKGFIYNVQVDRINPVTGEVVTYIAAWDLVARNWRQTLRADRMLHLELTSDKVDPGILAMPQQALKADVPVEALPAILAKLRAEFPVVLVPFEHSVAYNALPMRFKAAPADEASYLNSGNWGKFDIAQLTA